jgi:hypothetical protein
MNCFENSLGVCLSNLFSRPAWKVGAAVDNVMASAASVRRENVVRLDARARA